ncbi:MAG: AAA family ATPase [Kineosporiaceae bacterium]|nr:AAA family ATPase [Kineosporiaceae bacterium]
MTRRLESMGWQAPSDAELQAALAAMGAWQSPEGIWHLHRPPQTTSHRSTTLAAELGIDPAELEAEETRSQTSEPPRDRGPIPRMWQEVADEIRQALSAELRAAQSEPDRFVELIEGVLVSRTPQRLLYSFVPRGSLDIADGARCRVQLGTRWYDAEVVSNIGGRLRVALPLHAPQHETCGQLRVDASFLIVGQIRHLDDVLHSARPFNAEAALALTRPVVTDRHDTSTQPVAERSPSTRSITMLESQKPAQGLNQDQLNAVQRSRQTGVSWIWGPPGTGKTTTLAALVEALMEDGLRVLVVSNTNAAVDTALERLLDTQEPSEMLPGRVLRVGTPSQDRLTERQPWPVLLDEEAARAGHNVAAAKMAMGHRIRTLRARRAQVQAHIRRLKRAHSRLPAIESQVKTLEHRLAQASVARAGAALKKAEQRVLQGQAAHLTKRQLATHRRDVQAAQEKVGKAPEEAQKIQEQLERAAEEAQALKTRIHTDQIELDQLKQEIEVLDGELAEAQAEERRLDRLMSYLRRQARRKARAVFATAHRCYLADLSDQKFDVVVIDEASMLSVPLAMFAAGLGRGHTVVAGDFRQLGPISKTSATSADARWMAHSVFEMAGINQAVTAGVTVPDMTILREQHRMRPEIAEFVGSAFYPEAGLITSPEIGARPLAPQLARCLPRREIFLVDTSSALPWMARAGGFGSRYTPLHALVVEALVRSIECEAGTEPPSIGVISPYNPQARLIRAMLTDHESTAEAATVHRYQGGERDVIIYDTVEATASGIGVHRWFTGASEDEAGPRLLNVALSRARDRLIVVADLHRLARAANAPTPVGRALAQLAQRAERLSWRSLIDAQPGADLRVLDSHSGAVHLEKSLANASKRIVLWSTAASRQVAPARLIQQALADAAGRGVQVTVWLPASRVAESWPQFRETTVALHPLETVRENVGVVDDEIVVSNGDLLTLRPGDLVFVRRGPLAADALFSLLRRRPTREAFGDGDPTRVCSGCGDPLTRVERWDQRVWARCDRCSISIEPDPPVAQAPPTGRRPAEGRLSPIPRPRTAPRVCPSCGVLPTANARCSCS